MQINSKEQEKANALQFIAQLENEKRQWEYQLQQEQRRINDANSKKANSWWWLFIPVFGAIGTAVQHSQANGEINDAVFQINQKQWHIDQNKRVVWNTQNQIQEFERLKIKLGNVREKEQRLLI